jgi:hypothetical protein
MSATIEYKATYNEGRGLPEPKWGPPMSEISPDYPIQCPTCGSHNMHASAHPDDPDEIFPHETVRCRDCGRITDWYEARCSWAYPYYRLRLVSTLRSILNYSCYRHVSKDN